MNFSNSEKFTSLVGVLEPGALVEIAKRGIVNVVAEAHGVDSVQIRHKLSVLITKIKEYNNTFGRGAFDISIRARPGMLQEIETLSGELAQLVEVHRESKKFSVKTFLSGVATTITLILAFFQIPMVNDFLKAKYAKADAPCVTPPVTIAPSPSPVKTPDGPTIGPAQTPTKPKEK